MSDADAYMGNSLLAFFAGLCIVGTPRHCSTECRPGTASRGTQWWASTLTAGSVLALYCFREKHEVRHDGVLIIAALHAYVISHGRKGWSKTSSSHLYF